MMNSECIERHVPVALIADYVWIVFHKITFSFFSLNVDP